MWPPWIMLHARKHGLSHTNRVSPQIQISFLFLSCLVGVQVSNRDVWNHPTNKAAQTWNLFSFNLFQVPGAEGACHDTKHDHVRAQQNMVKWKTRGGKPIGCLYTVEYIYTILINFIHVFAQFITVHVWICLYNGVNLFRQAVPCIRTRWSPQMLQLGGARPVPGWKFRKVDTSHRKKMAMKLWGASTNEQMAVEMPMRWHERIHAQLSEWTHEPMNQWCNEPMLQWIDESVNQ